MEVWKKQRTKKHIMDELVDHARWEPHILSTVPSCYLGTSKDPRKPGEKILALSPEDREKLKDLTASDLDRRLDELLFLEEGKTLERKGRLGKYLEQQLVEHLRETRNR